MELCNEAIAAWALPSFELDFEMDLKPNGKQISELMSFVDDHYVLAIDHDDEGSSTKVFRRGSDRPLLSLPRAQRAILTQDKNYLVVESLVIV